MSWATSYIDRLQKGETCQFRPRGNSMVGLINSGDLVTVAPIGERALVIGDIVLCKVKGCDYLHLVKAIQGERHQIGNNRGHINGWTHKSKIYGIVTAVE